MLAYSRKMILHQFKPQIKKIVNGAYSNFFKNVSQLSNTIRGDRLIS